MSELSVLPKPRLAEDLDALSSVIQWSRDVVSGTEVSGSVTTELQARAARAVLAGLQSLDVTAQNSVVDCPEELRSLIFSLVRAGHCMSHIFYCWAQVIDCYPEAFGRPEFEEDCWNGAFDSELIKGYRVASKEEAARLAAMESATVTEVADYYAAASASAERAIQSGLRPFRPISEPVRERTTLYLSYDKDDILLYVGITNDLPGRQALHELKSTWKIFEARMVTQVLPDRPTAERVEIELIQQLRPLFNSKHNSGPDARLRLVRYLVNHDRLDLLAPAVSRG